MAGAHQWSYGREAAGVMAAAVAPAWANLSSSAPHRGCPLRVRDGDVLSAVEQCPPSAANPGVTIAALAVLKG
jgi:hypothetical protein